MNKETREWIDRLTDHPADVAMKEYAESVRLEDWRILRTWSGSERKALWDFLVFRCITDTAFSNCLEVGTNCGASAWFLSHFVHRGGAVRGVEINAEECEQHRMRLMTQELIYSRHRVFCGVHYGTSADPLIVCDVREFGPYDFIMIDGDHSYEGVKADWDNYFPMLRDGGIICLHDTNNSAFGVKRLWNERKGDLRWLTTGGAENNLGWGIK